MWQKIYTKANPQIKKFMMKIPKEDLSQMTETQAIYYIKEAMSKYTQEVNTNYGLRYNNNENPVKHDLLRGEDKTITEDDTTGIIDKLMQGVPAKKEKISALKLQLMNDILLTGKTQLNRLINYDNISLPRHSILLDSKNRNLTGIDYNWNLVPFSSYSQGQVYTHTNIQQVVEVSCGIIKMPVPKNLNKNILTGIQNDLFYKRIRMGIQEFAGQGIEININDKYNRREYFHFEFETTLNGSYWELKPVATWKPNKVISQCNSITLNFFGNTEKMILDVDRQLCVKTAGTPTIFTTPAPHNLTTGDLVYVLDGELYNEQGYLIAVLSATSFEIMQTTTVNESVNVYYASKRIQVQLNFICIE